ncbi:glycosyltransferase [bacterium]|nr:glycosyltransferase [bacterium]MBU1675350.1 glycosyltransferase [bacterium]
MPELSVIVPVRNEALYLGVILGQLLEQSLARSRFEILVVDGMSTDNTHEIVTAIMDEHPNVRLLDNPAGLSGCARNVGVEHARAPYVLFVDGHCHIRSRDMLAAVLKAFADGALCVSRPQPLIRDGVSRFQAATAAARTSWLGHHTGSQIYTADDHLCSPLSAGCGYARDLFRELGGIDETFDAGEDLEFNLRVHQRGIYAHHSQDFEVGYFPRRSCLALFRQLYRYGSGRARMARKHPRQFSPLSVALMLLVLWILLMPLVAPFWSPAWRLWAVPTLIYAIPVVALSGWLSLRRGVSWPLTIAAFLASHFGGGLGYLSGLVGGPQWSHSPGRVLKPTDDASGSRSRGA